MKTVYKVLLAIFLVVIFFFIMEIIKVNSSLKKPVKTELKQVK